MSKEVEEEHQTTAHTDWRIWSMIENLLAASVWTADLTSLILAISCAGMLFRSLQFLKLPGTAKRLPIYLLSCVLGRVLVAGLPPFEFFPSLPH